MLFLLWVHNKNHIIVSTVAKPNSGTNSDQGYLKKHFYLIFIHVEDTVNRYI